MYWEQDGWQCIRGRTTGNESGAGRLEVYQG